MCLILVAYQMHPKYPLIVAANRDEFYARPTAAAHFWKDEPEILAGRDLEQMGTWMGVTKNGRFCALTNYRAPDEMKPGKRSRGELVANALRHTGSLEQYMKEIARRNTDYPGYNLLYGTVEALYYYSNKAGDIQQLTSGIYGVSNHLLNTEWPKVAKGKEMLQHVLEHADDNALIEQLLSILQNSEQAPDEQLPDTGISYEMEKLLSAMFIKSEDYGTRSSTVLLMSSEEIHYTERVFEKSGQKDNTFYIKR